MNNKGISLITLAFMIVVIIILASITTAVSVDFLMNSSKASFLESFENAVLSLETYNTRGIERGLNNDFSPKNLTWDGVSERAQNTARIEDSSNEDRVSFILNDMEKDNNLKGKIEIKSGDLYIKTRYSYERSWASEKYKYLED